MQKQIPDCLFLEFPFVKKRPKRTRMRGYYGANVETWVTADRASREYAPLVAKRSHPLTRREKRDPSPARPGTTRPQARLGFRRPAVL